MKLWFGLATLAVVSATAACTLVVSSKFADVDLTGGPPDGSTPQTALQSCLNVSTAPDTYTGCRDCMIRKCSDEVTIACGPPEKNWTEKARLCAQDPTYHSYNCRDWDPDYFEGGLLNGDQTSNTVEERAFDVCVRDQCMTGAPADCKQCFITYTTSSMDTYPLNHSGIGQCLQASCGAELVRCCGQRTITDELEPCAYPEDPTQAAICRRMLDYDRAPDAGVLDPSGDADPYCVDLVSRCAQLHCRDAFPAASTH